MSPERRNPSDQLNESEWQELAERLPVLFDLAESQLYTHQGERATTAIFSINHEDNRGVRSEYYYVYRAEHSKTAITMYSIDPAMREIWVNSDVDFNQLANLDGLINHLQFDEITGANMPAANNLAGLREFMTELREQDALFDRLLHDDN